MCSSLSIGDEVVVPTFDKAAGRNFPDGRVMQLEKGGIVIIEGPWSSAEEVCGHVPTRVRSSPPFAHAAAYLLVRQGFK